jgi:transcriptional regulator with XRE-family HTH domain
MIIGDRLRALREEKKLSQGDIEKRTGLLRCYVSRVENRHTVPAVETIEKFARALEVPIYQLFYDGDEPPKLPSLLNRKSPERCLGQFGQGCAVFEKTSQSIGQIGRKQP